MKYRIIGKEEISNVKGNNKPHALTSFLPAAGVGFSGNQVITYTDFKKMRSITEGNTSLTVTYGVDEQRIQSVLTKPSGTLTRYYLSSYEEEIENGRTRRLHYIAGGDGLAAIYVQGSDGQDSLYYVYTDYQGSLIALTTHDGTVKERYGLLSTRTTFLFFYLKTQWVIRLKSMP